ncbi:MAG: glycosyltransferase family 2 protein [Patescibacteria group bacterium]|nr:glycosyltransferase family 2 protein [Patescibacteria group bacterium]
MNLQRLEIRLYEIIPGALVWLTLVLSLILSYYRPLWMVYFIIVYDLYWLFRVVYYLPFVIISFFAFKRDSKIDWLAKAQAQPGFRRIYHVIMLPTVREELPVLQDCLDSLLNAAYQKDRFIVVLGGEERAKEAFEPKAKIIQEKYSDKFSLLMTTLHPKDLPGEMIGKGSNVHWMGLRVLEKIKELNIEIDDVIVHSFDVDTVAHPQYFACVAYKFLTVEKPHRASYQPMVLYNNNLWESPAAVRVAMFGTTFWLMTELPRAEGMMTFSSHSMTLRMLVDVGFWSPDVVSEDSRIFLLGLIRYSGDYRVIPIHLPVSMDTVMGGSYWKALFALYRQMQRWAYGVENFPYMVSHFVRDPKMPFWTKAKFLFKQLEGMYTWATVPLLIFLLGNLPFWLAPEQFRSYAVFQNTPFTLEWLMRFAMIGVFASAFLALLLLPPRPNHVSRWQTPIVMLFQWILLPVTFVLFGAIPAIDSQTRLMLGKYLGFIVSPKRGDHVKHNP